MSQRQSKAFLVPLSLFVWACANSNLQGSKYCAQTTSIISNGPGMATSTLLQGGFVDVIERNSSGTTIASRRCTTSLEPSPDFNASGRVNLWTAMHCIFDDSRDEMGSTWEATLQLQTSMGYLPVKLNIKELNIINESAQKLHFAGGDKALAAKAEARVARYLMGVNAVPEARCNLDTQSYIIRGESAYINDAQNKDINYPYEVGCFDFVENLHLNATLQLDSVSDEMRQLILTQFKDTSDAREKTIANLKPEKIQFVENWKSSFSLYQSQKRKQSWIELKSIVSDAQCAQGDWSNIINSKISESEGQLLCSERATIDSILKTLGPKLDESEGADLIAKLYPAPNEGIIIFSDLRNQVRRDYVNSWDALSAMWTSLTVEGGPSIQSTPGIKVLDALTHQLYLHSNFKTTKVAGSEAEVGAPHYSAFQLKYLLGANIGTEVAAGITTLLYRSQPGLRLLGLEKGDSGSQISLFGFMPIAVVSTLSTPLEKLEVDQANNDCKLCTEQNFKSVVKSIGAISGGAVVRPLPVSTAVKNLPKPSENPDGTANTGIPQTPKTEDLSKDSKPFDKVTKTSGGLEKKEVTQDKPVNSSDSTGTTRGQSCIL